MGLLASGDLGMVVWRPNLPCRGRASVGCGGEIGGVVGGVGGRRAGWEGLVANTTDIASVVIAVAGVDRLVLFSSVDRAEYLHAFV